MYILIFFFQSTRKVRFFFPLYRSRSLGKGAEPAIANAMTAVRLQSSQFSSVFPMVTPCAVSTVLYIARAIVLPDRD